MAVAWQQTGWADYSGVGRTLQALTQAEAEAIVRVLREIAPIIDEQVTQALVGQGRLISDGDLTGRPVSNTSTTYPEAAFGHVDDEVRLGYPAAVVVSVARPMAGIGSPSSRIRATWCRVCWPKNWSWPPKPVRACGLGGGPSCSANVGRPCALSASQAEQRLAQRQAGWAAAQAELQVRTDRLQTAEATLAALIADYQERQRHGATTQSACSGSAAGRDTGSVSTPARRRSWRTQPSSSHATRLRSSWCRRRKAGYRPVCSVSSTRMPPIPRP